MNAQTLYSFWLPVKQVSREHRTFSKVAKDGLVNFVLHLLLTIKPSAPAPAPLQTACPEAKRPSPQTDRHTDRLLSAIAPALLVPETFPLNVSRDFRRFLHKEVIKLACLITNWLSVVSARRKYMRFQD